MVDWSKILATVWLVRQSLKEIDREVILPSITNLGMTDPYEQFDSGSIIRVAMGGLLW